MFGTFAQSLLLNTATGPDASMYAPVNAWFSCATLSCRKSPSASVNVAGVPGVPAGTIVPADHAIGDVTVTWAAPAAAIWIRAGRGTFATSAPYGHADTM